MAPPFKSEEAEAPTSNLWVGNLSVETVDSDLMELFGQYGELDSVKMYAARSFAFLYFKRAEDAKAAKDALQGAPFHGNHLRIEFARPVRPSTHIWVGGISPNVSKEDLEEEFCKVGKIKDLTFFRDRNTAFVEYLQLDDASEAVKSMNGKRVGGQQLRVDFLRSQSFRREQGPFSNDQKDGSLSHSMSKRPHSQLGGQKDQPSKTLWIGHPPTLQIDEQMLHNAMILFGEIEKIKSFPSRYYSFVEFRSVEEARRAKEGLQGRLFNDPRITIMFSHSEIGPAKDNYVFHGIKGPRPDAFSNGNHFKAPPVDMYAPSSGVLGPNQLRALGNQGAYDPSGPEYNDLAARRGMQDVDPKNWRPSPSILSPTHGLRPQTRQSSSSWDGYDGNQFQRDPKRSRIEASLSAGSPRLGNPDNDYIWRGLIAKGGTPVCHARCVPIGKGIGTELPITVNCSARTGLDTLTKHYAEAIGFDIVYFLPDCEDDFASYTEFLHYLGSKNRAGVAKFDDGTTLFLVPPSEFLTKVLKVEGPERLYGVVLTLAPQAQNAAPVPKHPPVPAQSDYNFSRMQQEQPSQTDYGRVLPEQPNQLPPRSLGQSTIQSHPANGSAAVPQSRVSLTPELLATLASLLPATSQSSTLGGAQSTSVPSTTQPLAQTTEISNGLLSPGLSQDQQALAPSGHSFQQSGNQFNASAQGYSSQQSGNQYNLPAQAYSSQQSGNQYNPSAQGYSSQQSGNQYNPLAQGYSSQQSGNQYNPLAQGYSSLQSGDQYNPSAQGYSSQQLGNQYNPSAQGYPSQQLGSQYNPSAQAQLPSFHHYPSIPSTPTHSTPMAPLSSQFQDSVVSLSQQTAPFSRSMTNFNPSQTVNLPVSAPVSQQYQPEVPSYSQNGYGMMHGTEASASYGLPAFQQSGNPNAASNQVNAANFVQPQSLMQSTADKGSLELPNQFQHQQSVPSGAGQNTSDDVDKNQRYQNTLQFASNLLLQIQQQQQQTNLQATQGSGK